MFPFIIELNLKSKMHITVYITYLQIQFFLKKGLIG